MPGKFIVFEGIDGSGKTTQTRLLINILRKKGKKVKTIHFPQHQHKVFGVLVDEYLNNKFGKASRLDYRLASILYACDRFEAKDKINTWLKQGHWIVLDRYVESNFGHQAGKIKNKNKRKEVMDWLFKLDYKIFKNPRPDIVFLLDVPEKIAAQLQTIMKKKKDGHEKDLIYLQNTKRAYLEACSSFKYWQKIKCVENKRLLTPREISDNVWGKLKK
ncbi:MAG: dTMP kinase [Candidatus Kuenenbacteria bacterium]